LKKRSQKATKGPREILPYLGLSSIFLTISFWNIPMLLLTKNEGNGFDPWSAGTYFVVAGLLVFLALLPLVFWLLPTRFRFYLAAALAAYGLCLFAFDTFLPLDIGPIENGDETMKLNLMGSILEGLVWIGLTVGILKLKLKETSKMAWTLSAVFILTSIPNFFSGAPVKKTPVVTSDTESDRPKFNVYHILFDGYFGPWLEWSMKELDIPKSDFPGFVQYRNARSNYSETTSSFASFMSGSLFDPSKNIRDWQQRADEDNLISDLKNLGFKTRVVAIASRTGYGPAEEVQISRPMGFVLLADFWLMRVVPVAFRSVVFHKGAGPLSRVVASANHQGAFGDLRSHNSYLQLHGFLDHEFSLGPAQGQYFHIYVHFPHPPYQLSRNGKFVGKSSYSEQHHLATQTIREIVGKIQKLGSYSESMIIFQSDHGNVAGVNYRGTRDPLRDIPQLSLEESQHVSEIDKHGMNGFEVNARYSPLLLIKAPAPCPHTERPLEISQKLVQLVDLRNFIKQTLKAKACEFPTVAKVDLFNGLGSQRLPGRKRKVAVGAALPSGTINHYSVDGQGNWKILEEVPFKY
jgi:hypothetical protein